MLMLDSQCKRCDDSSLNQKSVGESRKDKVHWVILSGWSQCFQFLSMLCLCCLGYGKGVWLVETCFRYPKYSVMAQPTATRGKFECPDECHRFVISCDYMFCWSNY